MCSPLVRAQAAVCGGQERHLLRGQFIQLHGEGGEAIVEQVILWLSICRVTQSSQVSCCCCSNVTLGFMLISGFGKRGAPFKAESLASEPNYTDAVTHTTPNRKLYHRKDRLNMKDLIQD